MCPALCGQALSCTCVRPTAPSTRLLRSLSGPQLRDATPDTTGTNWWRIHKAINVDHAGASSAPLRLVVQRAAITAVHADAAGDDRCNLNGEYVLVRNTGRTAHQPGRLEA